MFQTQIKRLQLRPWSEFFDYTAMSLPGKRDTYDRLNVNLAYYNTNYMILLLVSLISVAFRHPLFIIGLLIESSIFIYLFYYRTNSIVFAGTTVSRRDLAIAYSVVATLISVLFGGWTFIYTFAFSIVVICTHSLLRARSLNARGTAFIDMLTTKPHSDAPNTMQPDVGADNGMNVVQPTQQQNQFKSEFRASMRAKYLKKGD